jgi:hypothetical protein
MGSGAMIIYISSFMKIGLEIQKLLRGVYRDTDSKMIS